MAEFHGKQGRLTFGAVAVSNVLSWSIVATSSTAESTAMSAVAVTAATHWKSYTAGYKSWTATVECLLEDSGPDPDIDTDLSDSDGGAVVFFEGLAAQSVRKYSGTAIVTGIAPAVDKDGVISVTYTLQGSGTLSVAASDYVP